MTSLGEPDSLGTKIQGSHLVLLNIIYRKAYFSVHTAFNDLSDFNVNQYKNTTVCTFVCVILPLR